MKIRWRGQNLKTRIRRWQLLLQVKKNLAIHHCLDKVQSRSNFGSRSSTLCIQDVVVSFSTSEVLGGKTFFLLLLHEEHLAVHLNDYFTGLYTTGCNFGLEKFINYFLSKLSLLLPKPIFIEQLGFLNSQKAFRDLNAIITITKKVELLFYNPSYNCSFLCATTVIIRQGESFPSGYKRCFSKKFCCSPEIFPTFSWVVSPLKKFRWNFPCLFHAIFLLDNDNNRAAADAPRNYSTFLCNWGGRENFNLGIFPVCYKPSINIGWI